ncbi:hypothetical protein ACFFON_08715 [Arthrobacter citreus]|uniref:hypothetical protein n=1 Tax=Arthrobacter TaxID=1663 RepID=UPI001264E0A1|nr:hypothetical protein [Arthrobacter gandavensis]
MDAERGAVEYEAFCDLARVDLERESQLLRENALDRLSSVHGSWHPTGFAVFHLNENHPLGILRLHIWPDNKRVVRPDGAPIHTHVWHLCSRILVGTYIETLFEKSEPVPDKTPEFHSAHINYLVDKDTFTASGKASLQPVGTTRFTEGEFHAVPADVPHETLISDRSFVATLLITSQPVADRVTMYSQERIATSTYNRPKITQDEKRDLLSRLEHEMKKQAGPVDEISR